MRPWARTVSWSALALLIGSAMLAATYYFFIQSLKGPIEYFDVYLWQFFAWGIWVAIAPAILPWLKRRLTRRHDWRLWASLVVLGFVILIVHAVWHGLASAAFSPYPTLTQFASAIGFHLRFGLPVDLAILAALTALAWREAVAESLGRQIEASERRFKRFFEDAVFGIFRSTPDGRFLMLNRSAANAMGYDTVDEALANVSDIANQIYSDPAERARYLEAMRRDGKVENWVWKMRRRDGSVLWNSETSRAVFGDAGELLYMEGTAKDITAEVEANAALNESERRSAELRVQLANAELRALKLQIKPHFLFNILNTIAMMIRTGETEKAQHAVTMLGSLFRRFLEFEGENTVTLEQELAFVELYLGLERYRFEDRIDLVLEVEDAARDVLVPTLILQPLVENAIKHGLAHVVGTCRLQLHAGVRDDALHIELVNDVATPAVAGDGYGIGLRNTRARLREHYGERASFGLQVAGGRARATVMIPLEQEGMLV